MNDQRPQISRASRSDPGLMNITREVMTSLFGLSDDTAAKVIAIIRNNGELQNLKTTLRGLSGVAWGRLNDAIDLAGEVHEYNPQQMKDMEFELGSEQEGHGDNEWMTNSKPSAEERVGESFLGFLMNEVDFTDADLRDPEMSQEIMRIMRASPAQAQQLTQRAEHDLKHERRAAMMKEKDPKKVALMRKQQNLRQQLKAVDQEVSQPDTGATVDKTGGKL